LKERREKDRAGKREDEDVERRYGVLKHVHRGRRPKDAETRRAYCTEPREESRHHGGRFDGADDPPEPPHSMHTQRHEHRHVSDETHGRLRKKKGTVERVLEWL
jgi:hypothetical protein